MAGIKFTHIPFKGLANAMTESISSQVSVMFSGAVTRSPEISNRLVHDALIPIGSSSEGFAKHIRVD